jgi:hypothetical protein
VRNKNRLSNTVFRTRFHCNSVFLTAGIKNLKKGFSVFRQFVTVMMTDIQNKIGVR